MTLAEFKAWFEGFTEDMDGAPNEKQFKRIKAKVKEITGTPITQHVIREYYDRYRPYWERWPTVSYGVNDLLVGSGAPSGMVVASNKSEGPVMDYPSTAALYDLGKAEYKAVMA